MNIALKSCLLAVAFTVVASIGSTNTTEAGNGWRWAKPLNQKPGSLLYTSNRKHKSSQTPKYHSYRRSNVYSTPAYQPRRYAAPVYTPPVYHAPVTVYKPAQQPVRVIHGNPVIANPVQTLPNSQPIRQPIRSAAPAFQPAPTAPSVFEQWTTP